MIFLLGSLIKAFAVSHCFSIQEHFGLFTLNWKEINVYISWHQLQVQNMWQSLFKQTPMTAHPCMKLMNVILLWKSEIITKLSLSNCLVIKDKGPYLTHLNIFIGLYCQVVHGENLFFFSFLIKFLDELYLGDIKQKH